MKSAFSREDSLTVKGVAIILLIWHHCFLPGRFEQYPVIFAPFTSAQVSGFAAVAKVCVGMFAFISGYGLYKSYNQVKGRTSEIGRWYRTRYIKSFSPFWFVVVLTWIVCFFLNRRPATVYFGDGKIRGILYMLIDFLGVGKLFGTPLMIATWWYMSACFVFIIVTPFLTAGIRKFGSLPMLVGLFILPRSFGAYPGGTHFLTFLPAFTTGMAFSEMKIFDTITSITEKSKKNAFITAAISIILSAAAYKIARILPVNQFWDINYGLFPGIYIIAITQTLSRLPGLRQTLQLLGKHSANIFWIHNFIRATYCQEFIYTRGHFLTVILVLLLLSLALSFGLELLKKLTRYDRLSDSLLSI